MTESSSGHVKRGEAPAREERAAEGSVFLPERPRPALEGPRAKPG